MLTKEQIEQLTPEQRAELLSLLNPVIVQAESETPPTESTQEVVTEETPQPVVEEQPKPQEVAPQPNIDEKLSEITKQFDEKFSQLIEQFGKQLDSRDQQLNGLKAELAETKRTAPTMVAQPTITQPSLEQPELTARSKANKSYFNSPSTEYVKIK